MHLSDPFLPILAALLVLLAPGAAFLAFLPARPAEDKLPGGWLSALGDAVALSIALSALLALWLSLPGIRLGGVAIVSFYALCVALVVVAVFRRALPELRPGPRLKTLALLLAGILIILAALAWRFHQAQSLALPAWVDSVHHTLIVKKMLEYGGLPPDLSPYLPVPFSYHYGFHLVTALFAFLSRLSPEQSVLWFGQVINALVALSLFRLGSALIPYREAETDAGRTREAVLRAGVAALLVTFAFQMPAYYLTWGRYTLLAGLVVTGPAMASAYEVYENPRRVSSIARFVVLFAGLFVTHYLAVTMVGIFLLVLGVAGIIRAMRKKDSRAFPWRLVLFGVTGLALCAPWLYRVWVYNHGQATLNVILPKAGNLAEVAAPNAWNYLIYLWGPRRNYILLGLAGIGALFALRRGGLRLLSIWGLALLLLSTPWGLRIGPFRPDLFNIVIFFPAALVLGDMLVSASEALAAASLKPLVGWAALAIVSALLLFWGARETVDVLNPATIFVTPGDVVALDWVKAHVPANARFLINSTLWQSKTYRGVDGGFWLLPYAGRFSSVPTSVYDWGSKAYTAQINDWAARAQKINGCTPDFWSLVRDAALTHIYLRVGAGNMTAKMFAGCAGLKSVYSAGGVDIFEIQAAP